MKKILLIIAILLTFFLFKNEVLAKKYYGNCYCFNPYMYMSGEPASDVIACYGEESEFEEALKNQRGGNICSYLCSKDNKIWYGDLYSDNNEPLSGLESIREQLDKCIESKVGNESLCVKVDNNTKANCRLSSESTGDDGTKCPHKFVNTKEACEYAGLGELDINGCCVYKSQCYFYQKYKSSDTVGELIWSDVSPCDTDTENMFNHYCEVLPKYTKEKCTNENASTLYDIKDQEKKDMEEKAKAEFEDPDIEPKYEKIPCSEIFGKTLTKISKKGITVLQLIGVLITIVKSMMILVPPIIDKDADALKKASSKLVKMGIILLILLTIRPFVNLLAGILDYDVSCII